MSINRVVLVGRLTRDPEMRTTTTGKSVCSFSLAVTKRIKPQDGSPDADFFSCSAWGQTAEYMANYITKGRLVAVEGRLQSRKYQASDGTNREVVEIVADNVQGLDRPRDDSEGGGGGGGYQRREEGSGYKGSDRAAVAPAPAPTAEEYDPFGDE